MNNLCFNPYCQKIEQWKEIYFSEEFISNFEEVSEKTHQYIEIIHNRKGSKHEDDLKQFFIEATNQEGPKNIQPSNTSISIEQSPAEEQNIKESIINIINLKQNLMKQHQQIQSIIEKRGKIEFSKLTKDKSLNCKDLVKSTGQTFSQKIQLCLSHLNKAYLQSTQCYQRFLGEEYQLLKEFTFFKMSQLQQKHNKISQYLNNPIKINRIKPKLMILFQNIFIECQYLNKMVTASINIFELHFNFITDVTKSERVIDIRSNYRTKLAQLRGDIHKIKKRLRDIYLQNFKKWQTLPINDQQKLQKIICTQIAVNAEQYSANTSSHSFLKGFISSTLLISIIAIIIFRWINIQVLLQNETYAASFIIWRGASYFIYINWIFAVVLFLFDTFKINYRMIMLMEDSYIPKYQSFLVTSVILSAIYLVLFLVYLLYQVKMIDYYPQMQNLGLFMWGINFAFLFNPFKILNYEGRRYFIKLFAKVVVSIFRPMDMNIFFLAIIIGSMVQPFSDTSYTICSVIYGLQSNCADQATYATFGFIITYLIYRFIQSIRSHIQFGTKFFSKPILGLIAIIFSMNTAISAFCYSTFLTNQLWVYWAISASLSTCTGCNADFRADWGLISFDSQDWILRKHKLFPRFVYFIICAIDIILNIGWALTISGNINEILGITDIYFTLILSYIELARKGMWIFFRMEDDHMFNVGMLKALASDQHIYQELEQILSKNKLNQPRDKYQITLNEIGEGLDKDGRSKIFNNGIKSLQDIQKMVVTKQEKSKALKELINELESYSNLIYKVYKRINLITD